MPGCGVCGEPGSVVVTVEWADSTDRYVSCVEHAMDLGPYASTVELITSNEEAGDA